nr:hypothetical protein CFP56_66593 [Quercus suber]
MASLHRAIAPPSVLLCSASPPPLVFLPNAAQMVDGSTSPCLRSALCAVEPSAPPPSLVFLPNAAQMLLISTTNAIKLIILLSGD